MTEELENLNLSEDLESNEIDSEDIESEVEAEARSMGWRPLEEWEGPKSKWRNAKEFVDRGSLFKKIDSQNKVIRELQESYKTLAEHHAKVAKLEREKVLKELNRQKKEALENQDFEALSEVDEQIIALKTAPDPEIVVPKAVPAHQENADQLYQEFVARNPWYKQDPELTELADTLTLGFAARKNAAGEPIIPSELFEYVEQKMAAKTKKTKPLPDPVIKSNRSSTPSGGGRKSKFTFNDLNAEQKQFARRFVQMGAFKNEQEYVDQLAELGELG